jgi:hypothetical protein
VVAAVQHRSPAPRCAVDGTCQASGAALHARGQSLFASRFDQQVHVIAL